MKSYGKLMIGLLVVWFAAALSASALHLFENTANRVGIAVGIAAGAPLVVFALWYAASSGFRQFLQSLNPVTLTALQAWRTIGFVFVVLEARHVLPPVFAWPAGYGDMFIGATAAFVAWKLIGNRGVFIFWNLLGIADLVAAVSLGTTARLLDPHGANMLPMTILPLSIIPTFLVPLFFIFHVICIAQARRWNSLPAPQRQTAARLQPKPC